MVDSVFTKIIKGQIPSHKVYEDDKTLAFMEIHPKTDGHVLVISKKQLFVWDLPDQDYEALMSTVRKVAERIREVLKPERVGMQVVGLHIPDHAHIHVFPFNTIQEYYNRPDDNIQADSAQLAKMAAKLAF